MTFPVTVTVEMKLGGSWTDVTSYVRVETGITMAHGIRNEGGGQADPSTCQLAVNNTDGRFTPKNTAGAYYGNLKRGTLLRVTVGSTVRFIGEISEFPTRWDESGKDVWVPLTASGITRRLLRSAVLASTLTTAVQGLSAANGDIVGYWPVEDGPNASQIASGLVGGNPGLFSGFPGVPNLPVFGAVDLSAGTHEVATWGGAYGVFYPTTTATATKFTAGFYVKLPSSGLTGGEELFRVDVNGTAQSWRVIYSPASGGGVFFQVIANDGTTELLATANACSGADGQTFYVKMECSNSGSNVAYAVGTLGIGSTISGSIASRTVGQPLVARIGAGTIAIPSAAAVAIGHVVLGNTDTALFSSRFDNGRAGYANETAYARVGRIATETGYTINRTTSTEIASTLLGPQPDGSILDVLRDAVKAEAGGILYDTPDGSALSLTFITRGARYNDQQAQMTLDYSAKQVVPPLEPTDDDAALHNDVTASRDNGSSARATLTSGALSTAEYPSGVGVYPLQDSYNVYADTQLPYLAQWVLALGTVDETRFPAVTVDLVANSGKVASAEAARPGYRLRITNLPAYAGAANVDLQILGWSEYVTNHERRITYVCDPGSVYLSVFELDDTVFGTLDDNRLGY